jgi:hypothetical protein
MTARRLAGRPLAGAVQARLHRLPAMGRTIGTMSIVRSASVVRMRRSLCRRVQALSPYRSQPLILTSTTQAACTSRARR